MPDEMMTADETPDVVEQAARVMADNRGRTWGMMLPEYRAEHLRDARALADAGLLADPADRDVEPASAHIATVWGYHDHQKARAERAEAEVAELRATVDRVRELAGEWKHIDTTPAQWAAARLEDALDPEGGAS